jgi:predicted nuclease of predicted toxin-antitoxin system
VDFKLDENLPSEACQWLRKEGHDALSVLDQRLGGAPDEQVAAVCQSESRTFITLDTDFANMLSYPPGDYSGIVVIRASDQSKASVLSLVGQFVTALATESPHKHLWIVEPGRIRIRGIQ